MRTPIMYIWSLRWIDVDEFSFGVSMFMSFQVFFSGERTYYLRRK